MRYAPEDRIREEQLLRLSTDEGPQGRQHREDVHTVDFRPKWAKTRDREKEEWKRLKVLTYEQASD
jgi:hypothetical protein